MAGGKLKNFADEIAKKKEDEKAKAEAEAVRKKYGEEAYKTVRVKQIAEKYGNKGRENALKRTVGFDTFQTDLSSMGKTIDGIYGGWQTPETMANTKNSIGNIQRRINAYQEYRKLYGGNDMPDLTELSTGYKSILNGWDSLSEDYSGYKDANEYKAAVERRASLPTADVNALETEIGRLEEILGKANEYEAKIGGYQNRKKTWEHRGNGLETDVGYEDKISAAEREYADYLKSVGYSSIEELKRDLQDKTVYKNQAKVIQNTIGATNEVLKDPKFEEYAAKGDALWGDEYSDIGLRQNPVAYYRHMPEVMNKYDGKEASKTPEFMLAKHGTDEEIKIYNAYIGKGDADGANRYANTIAGSLNAREAEEIAKEKDTLLEKILYIPEAGFDQFAQGVANLPLFNYNKDYITPSATQIASGEIRGSLDGFWGGVYDFGTTTFNMLPSIGASILSNAILPGSGAVVGNTLMGASATGNAYQEKINDGWDKDQAALYSTAVGVSEAGLQHLLGGIGKLGGKISGKSANAIARGIDSALGRFAITYGSKMASEGLEEALQEVITPFLENFALGYDENDLTDVEWGQVAYSGLLGALSAGLFEGVSTGRETFGANKDARRIGAGIRSNGKIAEMLEAASLTPEQSEAYKLYTSYAKKGINSDNATDLQLGRLYDMADSGAKQTLSTKGSTLEQRESATETLKRLSEIKKKATEQQTRDANSPRSDVRNASAGVAFKNNISQETDAVKVYERLEAQSRNNEPIAAEDVQKATGFGEEGSKLIAEIANADGVTFSQAEKAVKNAYMAGFADVDSTKVSFVTDTQIDAFTAGKKDRVMQDLSTKENAKNVVVNKESGFYAKNLPSDVTKKQVEIVDQIAKAVGVKAYMAEGLEENAELNRAKGEVIIDSDFEREIGTGNNRQKVSIVFHAAHEMALHRVVELAPEEGSAFVYAMYNHLAGNDTSNYTLADQKRNAYAEQGVEISLAKAMEEVSANNILYLYNNDETKFQKTIDDILNGTNEKAKQGLKKYVEYLKEIIEKIRDFLTGKTSQERAEIQAELDEITKLRNMFETAFTRAVESRKTAENAAQNSASEMQGETAQKKTNTKVDVAFSLKKTDVDALRSIGRKSVNSFATEDIKKAEKFANRMWKELGVKSPFFRAWFGDWRADDSKTRINIVEVNERIVSDDALPKNIGVLLRNKLKNNELFRGDVINSDTGYKIQIGAFGYNDTLTYAQRELRKKGVTTEEAFRRINALSKIDELIQNAVLFDTEVIVDEGNPNRSFMHSFYIVAKVGGVDELIKIKVDELESPTNPTKRFYNLNDFEIINKKPLAVNWDLNPSTDTNGSKGIASASISISDLFNLVKDMDVNFKPKTSSAIVDEEGKPLIVYHGTDKKFTTFDMSKGRANMDIQGSFFSPWELEAKGYGSNVGKYYLSIKNPADGATAFAALNRFKGQDNAGVKAREYLIKQGYDGVNFYDEEYVAFHPMQIKSAADNIGTFDKSDPDINYSLKGTAVEGEIAGLVKKYGAIPSGENPARDVSVPKKTSDEKKVSQTVRTILEAKVTPDEAVPSIEELVAKGEFSYDVYTDKEAIAEAEETIAKKSWEAAKSDWYKSVGRGDVSKKNTAEGWVIYNNAVNSGEMETALEVLNFMVKHQRSAAQALQATRILKKLSPETQLYGVQKSVTALQEELKEKYGDKAPDLKIDEKLAENFLNAKTEDERAAAEAEIYKDIGRQMPSRFIDKWNAWRYLSMLGNARTHIRNIVGNAGFAPVVMAKDLTATAIESVVYRVSGKKTLRGKSLIAGSKADRELLKAAWADYGNVSNMISNGGKYSDSAMANQYIEEGRQIFKTKPLEWARKGNSRLLEVEDMWFAKPHYAYALTQYCKANNITAEQIKRGRAIAPAREYAIKEAQKATYRDTNAFSQMVSSWGRSNKEEKNVAKKAVNTVIEGILPFRKTPANILVRGIEYSPLGLLKGLSYDLIQVNKGKMSAAEAIDNISAGLTGTGLLALGVLLASQGLIRGRGGDDDNEKKFSELMGHQTYALELPDGSSVTLDWLAPEALSFFVGVNLWETAKGSNEETNLSTIIGAVSNISEPMLEMSCLQGLNDLFEGIGYASSNDTSGLVSVVSSAVTSYLTQGIPTLLGQAERTGEEDRMTTYTEKNSFLTGDMQYTLGKISAKIPVWDYNQIPYIDAWGRKEASGTALERGLNNFLNPAYTSSVETSSMEKELLRLYERTGESGVFPERADKYFTVDGVRKDLTAYEYVRYATLKGQKSHKLVSDLVKSKGYKKLSDEEKVKAIKEAYDYASQKAKQAISNYKPESWVNKADEFGSNVGNYISFKTEVSGAKQENGGKISKSEVVDIIFDMAQNDSETWKMYLSMYDTEKDLYAYNEGIEGRDYMNFLISLDKYDEPTKSGKYGTYTQEEAYRAIKNLKGLSREEKAILFQSVNTSWKKNPFR